MNDDLPISLEGDEPPYTPESCRVAVSVALVIGVICALAVVLLVPHLVPHFFN